MFALIVLAAVAWEDPAVNSENRLPARTYAMPLASEAAALTDDLEPETPYAVSLNGDWKFNWVGDPNRRPADFYRTDFDDRDWYTIDVPSCVEMRGFGTPHYTNQKYPHADLSHPTNAAFAAIRDRQTGAADNNPVSSYRRTFTVPESWNGRRVILRFDGVYSAYAVWVNGQKVGYAEDSKLPSEFDITAYLNLQPSTSNLLAVEVYKWCDGSYLEDQDMMRFSGIFRDVTLWSMPKDGVWDFCVKTTPVDGYERWRLVVEVEDGADSVALYDADKKKVSDLHRQPLTSAFNLDIPARAWSAEDPYLYTLVVRRGDDVRMKRVGFKEQKVVGNTILVNGRAIKFKGVNRHEASPENGRAITRADMLRDIELLKKYNFNTVRTSHYPDHRFWYDLCDRYGIYLMAEANVEAHEPGYREKGLGRFPEWEHSIMERNLRHVAFYRNHPSVTFWSVGNETGHGDVFRQVIAAVRRADPSRPIHWERGNVDADFDSSMYATVDWLDKRGQFGDGLTNAFDDVYADHQTGGRPFFFCEYSHAMGNSVGNFQEYWDVVYRYKSLVGGCIWDWIDQAVWKETDKLDQATGRRERYLAYGGDFDDQPNDGNFSCNGLIGPERKVSAKLVEVGHVHRNLVVRRREDGMLELSNLFGFLSADSFDGEWELVGDGKTVRRGCFTVPPLAPQAKCALPMPEIGVVPEGEVLLNINFVLKADTLWAKKGWPVSRNQVRLSGRPAALLPLADVRRPVIEDGGLNVRVTAGGTKAEFCRKTGTLSKLVMNGTTILDDPVEGLVAGPRLTYLRAFTDNDYWLVSESEWHAGWGRLPLSGLLQPRWHVRSFAVTNGTVRVVTEITGAKSAGFVHEAVWSFGENGCMDVKNIVTPFGTMPPAIPRLGLSLKMDKRLENVEWYGRGPRENYVDRCTGSFFGVWSSLVKGLEESCVRPQDNGYRTGVRWVSFTDRDGKGVRFSSSEPMCVQALRCGWEDMEFARHRITERRIRSRVVSDDWTNLNLDIRQLGLGGASCGNNPPLKQYRFPIERTEWTTRIEPVRQKCSPVQLPRWRQGAVWTDAAGYPINAHGGCVMYHAGRYYWYGEHKVYGGAGNRSHVGVHVYSSSNLNDWEDCGIALAIDDKGGSLIGDGCVIERPKVVRAKTGKFVMYFHLELQSLLSLGRGYFAAYTGIAVSDRPEGPFTLVSGKRPNSDKSGFGGYESRDQTLFVDDDGSVWQFFSTDLNRNMRVSRLTDDCLGYTGETYEILTGDTTEAPAVFKRNGVYWMIGSGCSGWAPNQARLYRADRISGPWKRLDNPCRGVNPSNGLGPEKTWGGQSAFVFPVHGSSDKFVAMFDIWNPKNQLDSRYVWLPVTFTEESAEVVWQDE